MIKDGIEYLDNVNWSFIAGHQKEQLETAKVVAKICEDNGLRYFLDCGTLLGALRHKGFIPWDDDIDFVMPRPDFERLLDVIRTLPNLKALSWNEDENCCLPCTKVMRWCNGDKLSHNSSAIDLFVIDAAPKNKVVEMIQLYLFVALCNVLIYRKRRDACKHPLFSCLLSGILPRDNSKVRGLFSKFLFISSKWKPNSYVGARYLPSGSKYFVRYSTYEDGAVRRAKFCDTEFCVPKHSEEFLTQFFGDWMKLPPIEQRVPKHEYDGAWFYSELKCQ